MKTINKRSKITIYWKIWRGVNKVTENFSSLSTNLKVFLMGHDDVLVLNPSVNKDVDPGYEVLEMTISAGTLGVGAYGIKAVWTKNEGRDLLTSMRSGVFGITDSDAEASVTDEEIRLVSSVESYGRDGMSAFETAVMRNLNNGISSEVEWVGNEAKRIADETARDVAEKARKKAEEDREDAEAKRVDTFNDNEETRQTTFETNETNRSTTFASNETGRENAYLSSEQDREVRFAAAEENRNKGEAIRQAAFEGGENNRATTFTRNEESRQRRFEDEVEQRAEAFNAYESSRQRAFEQAEKDRGVLFRSKEDAREADELKREQAEAIRNAQESVRQQAEQIRIDTFDENERGRIATFNANEAARIAAESERNQNEAQREANEAIRQESYKDKLPVSAVVQETGDGENVVMSQKAVSGKLDELESNTAFESLIGIIIHDKFYNPNNGGLSENTSLDCTKLIPVAGQVYVHGGVPYYTTYYDENKNFLGGEYYTINVSDNVKYIGLSFLKSNAYDYAKLRLSYVREYQYPYDFSSVYISERIQIGKAYQDKTGSLVNLSTIDCTELIELPADCDFISLSKNKFYSIVCFDEDKKFIGSVSSAVKCGSLLAGTKYVGINFLASDNNDYTDLYVSTNNSMLGNIFGYKAGIIHKHAIHSTRGELLPFETLDCTQLEKIDHTKQLYLRCNSPIYEIACFDKDMKFLGGGGQLKPNTAYFSVSFLVSDNIDYTQLRISVKEAISSLILPVTRASKKYYLFGDSITYWDSRTSWYDDNVYMVAYPSYIREVLGASISNQGVAGQRSDQITSRLMSTDLSDAYAVTYMAGSNDVQQNVPIETYKENIRIAVEYVMQNYPSVKFYLISPPYYTNSDITPYGNAMQEVAEEYAVPIIRWDKVGGINKVSSGFLTVEGLHPNNEGHRLFADSLIPFLQNH